MSDVTRPIYEDKYFLAINKGPSVVAENNNFQGLHLIHRLDKDTSGVLLLAKDLSFLDRFQDLFKRREVKKTYLGLFFGHILVRENRGLIEAPIRRIPDFGEKFGVVHGGRPSQTAFKVLRYFKYKGFDLSFVEIYPLTGRTHQIRVHFASYHWPLVGDKLYTPERFNAEISAPRQFLHAKSIAFRHPYTDEAIRIEAALPTDLRSFLKIVEKLDEINEEGQKK